MTSPELLIGGIEPFSTVDWPGQLVVTVFCQGCSWACPYCHNPALRSTRPGARPMVSWPDVQRLLEERAGLLDGVVFSGGEPTQQHACIEAARRIAGRGYAVGVHTTGAEPAVLTALMPFVSWVGFDLKAPIERYERVTGVAGSGAAAHESLGIIIDAGVEIEVRTTVHSALLSPGDLVEMARFLREKRIGRWVLQTCRGSEVLRRLGPSADLSCYREAVEGIVEEVLVR